MLFGNSHTHLKRYPRDVLARFIAVHIPALSADQHFELQCLELEALIDQASRDAEILEQQVERLSAGKAPRTGLIMLRLGQLMKVRKKIERLQADLDRLREVGVDHD
jgi:hypothetical protein